jgi:hypothetical protein
VFSSGLCHLLPQVPHLLGLQGSHLTATVEVGQQCGDQSPYRRFDVAVLPKISSLCSVLTAPP